MIGLKAPQDNDIAVEEKEIKLAINNRAEDDGKAILEGLMYKLDEKGDQKDPNHWREHNMWIANNGSLCYHSVEDKKRIVLLDGAMLQGATFSKLEKSALGSSFVLETK